MERKALRRIETISATQFLRLALLASTAFSPFALSVSARAQTTMPTPDTTPQGGVVSAGSASIAQAPDRTTITQTSQRAALDWQSFNVGSRAQVQFVQPSASSIALNRVVSPDPSVIAGRINANGQIVLINQSGVVFTQGSQVNAESVVVSTSNVANKDFMAGHLIFSGPPNPGAKIINDGKITARNAGLVGLVAPQVANNGVITATVGQVVLAGATAFTLDLYGDRLISLDVTKAVTAVSVGGRLVPALVTNSGIIIANGGHITLTAQDADALVTQLIDAGGTIQADSVGSQTGTISIDGVGGNIEIAGNLLARGTAAGTKGGAVEALTTGTVSVASSAVVDASGNAGGGVIAIGTDLTRAQTGQSDTAAPKAAAVSIAQGAVLRADATGTGNGGTVTLLSSQNTDFGGAISVQGGQNGGNGGLAEISTDGVVELSGAATATAVDGQAGEILLDPLILVVTNNTPQTVWQQATPSPPPPPITVGGPGDNPNGTSYITTADLDALSGNVILSATDEISVQDAINMSNTSLTLETTGAGGAVNIDASINVTGGPSSLEIDAGTGGINIGSATQVGDVELGADNVVLNTTGAINEEAPTAGTNNGGYIDATILAGSSGGSALLTNPGNQIGAIGVVGSEFGFSTTGDFALQDAIALTVNDKVDAPNIWLADTDTDNAINAITINAALNTGATATNPTGSVSLTTTKGNVIETGNGVIDTAILAGNTGSASAALLTNTNNAVSTIGATRSSKADPDPNGPAVAQIGAQTGFTATSDFALQDAIALTVNDKVDAPNIWLADTDTDNAINAITINAALNTGATATNPTGSVSLTTTKGNFIETGNGVIDTAILAGNTGSASAALLTNTNNAVSTIGATRSSKADPDPNGPAVAQIGAQTGFTATSDFALQDAIALTVNDKVDAPNIWLADTDTDNAINAITINAALNTGATATNPTGSVSLTTTKGNVIETGNGVIDTAILAGNTGSASAALLTNTNNAVSTIGATRSSKADPDPNGPAVAQIGAQTGFTATSDFALQDAIALTVNDKVDAPNIWLADTDTDNAINAITINAALNTGATATNPTGSVSLTTTKGNFIETGNGVIDTAILAGNTGSASAALLTNTNNAVSTIGATRSSKADPDPNGPAVAQIGAQTGFTATSDFALQDAIALTVNDKVDAPNIWLADTDTDNAINAITINAALNTGATATNPTGSVSLTTTKGNVIETGNGVIDTAILAGNTGSASAALLTNTNNAVSTIGATRSSKADPDPNGPAVAQIGAQTGFTATSDFALQDAIALTVNDKVDAPNIWLADTDTDNAINAITINAALNTGATATNPTGSVSLTTTKGNFIETGNGVIDTAILAGNTGSASAALLTNTNNAVSTIGATRSSKADPDPNGPAVAQIGAQTGFTATSDFALQDAIALTVNDKVDAPNIWLADTDTDNAINAITINAALDTSANSTGSVSLATTYGNVIETGNGVIDTAILAGNTGSASAALLTNTNNAVSTIGATRSSKADPDPNGPAVAQIGAQTGFTATSDFALQDAIALTVNDKVDAPNIWLADTDTDNAINAITINAALNTGATATNPTGSVSLTTTKGNVIETGNGVIDTAILAGNIGSASAALLTNTNNAVSTIGATRSSKADPDPNGPAVAQIGAQTGFTATSDFALQDAIALTVNDKVDAPNIWLADTDTDNAINAITINAALNTGATATNPTGSVSLTTTKGNFIETGNGVIDTAILAGNTGSASAALLTNTNNAVSTIGATRSSKADPDPNGPAVAQIGAQTGFTATSDFALQDAIALTVNDKVDAPNIWLADTDTDNAINAITINAALNTGATATNPTGSVSLTTTKGNVIETGNGVIDTAILAGNTGSASAALLTNTNNAVSTIGATRSSKADPDPNGPAVAQIGAQTGFTATSDFALQDAIALTVNDKVDAPNIWLADTDTDNAINAITINAALDTSANSTGSVSLATTYGNITETANGVIFANILAGSTGTLDAGATGIGGAFLTNPGNQIDMFGTVGPSPADPDPNGSVVAQIPAENYFTSNGAFDLSNNAPFLFTGTLTANSVSIIDTGLITLADNAELFIKGNIAPPNTPAPRAGDSIIESTVGIEQANPTDIFYVNAGQTDPNGNGSKATLFLITTDGAPITFAPAPNTHPALNIGLVAPDVDLVIDAGTSGVVTGNVNLQHLEVISAKSVNLTGFIKTTAGQSVTGPAAAANGSVFQTPLPVYKINDCPIGSVNCTILPAVAVPVTDPLGNFDLSQRKRKHLYRNVQMPGIATRDY